MSNYLIELAIVHVTLIVGYWLFLRKEHQYAKMRFYLIASTLLALVIPLLKLPKLFFDSGEPTGTIPTAAIYLDDMIITPAAGTTSWHDGLLIWVYAAISALFLLKFLSGIVYLIYVRLKSRREELHGLDIRRVSDITGTFTFFHWIFVSAENPGQQEYSVILKHEKAHVSLGHTYDILFFELFKVCFWWLPTAWFVIKEIKIIHEYQADACALKSCDVNQYSSILISSSLKTNGLTLASSFHEGLIFKRLIAMKQQAKNVSPWKLGVLSVLCAILFIAFACSEEPNKDVSAEEGQGKEMQGKIFTVVEAQPEFQGGSEGFFKYLMNEMKYPKEAREKGIEGRVEVEFVVDKDGTLSEVKAIEGIGSGCDEEAVRVLKNAPAFKPGTQNGKPVRVRMMVPIVFKLNEGKTNPDNTTQGIIIFDEIQPRHEKFKVDADYANGEWSGTVYDEQGEPLPGVNIVVIGTTNGTSSGLDGTFKLKADRSNDVSLSFIGYETVRLNGR